MQRPPPFAAMTFHKDVLSPMLRLASSGVAGTEQRVAIAIAVEKSLGLYRERPGRETFGLVRLAGRGGRDTAICSKPSTDPMGSECWKGLWSMGQKLACRTDRPFGIAFVADDNGLQRARRRRYDGTPPVQRHEEGEP